MLKIIVGAAVLGFLLIVIDQSESCNEAVCGSIVSKCLLTQSCKCDLKNCTCCKDCFNCLSYLYPECCSCVDMCPKPNETNNALSKSSHIEDFKETVPGLFKVLTEYPDEENRWDSFTYPVDIDMNKYPPLKEMKIMMQTSEQEVAPKSNMLTLNCTVAFLSDCLSSIKCKNSCLSMGASSYRWFHNGCCECIGEYCVNYGINESRCRKCPKSDEDNEEELNEDDYDYGENDDDFMEIETNE